jgi:hypothetical protein
MNRWTAALVAAGVCAGAVLMFPGVSGAPVDERHAKAEPVATPAGRLPVAVSDAVQVEHEFVVARPSPRRSPEPRRQVAAARPAARAVGEVPQAQPAPGLVTRAGRVLLGDGQYRPEPFPRPEAKE